MKLYIFILCALVCYGFSAENDENYKCTCKSGVCTNIPSDGNYYLTSFCD